MHERRQCFREKAADKPLIVKRELLEEIFDVDVELIGPEFSPAGENAVDAVLLAGQEGFEIFEGLGIVHIHERIQARADVKHHVGGISEDDHPRGAKPESRMTPGRTQEQKAGE